jgi:hypothetical protein
MKVLLERLTQLKRIISKCENGSAGKAYYIGRMDEVKYIIKRMKEAR